MKISVIIIEDNPITCLDLKDILSDYGFEIIGDAHSYVSGIRLLEKLQPDLLLVDISLKGEKTGIDFVSYANQVLPYKTPTVYLTANSDEKTRNLAYLTNPSAFLTKPYTEKDLQIALELAFHNSISTRYKCKKNEPIYIRSHNEYAKIYEDDILFIKAKGSYCEVKTTKKEFLLSFNLNHCLKKLSEEKFIRIHRSYLVNKNHIREINHSYVIIYSHQIPIGRSYKDGLLKELQRLG